MTQAARVKDEVSNSAKVKAIKQKVSDGVADYFGQLMESGQQVDISKIEQLVTRYKQTDKANKIALNTFLKDGT